MKPIKYTVPRKDLRVDVFRGSGAGGQNRNKRDTGVRITHTPSGAVGECEEERSQLQNRNTALRRMTETKKFMTFIKMQLAAMEQGYRSIDAKVDKMMNLDNLKIEAFDESIKEWKNAK